jgi:hypothetical protein
MRVSIHGTSNSVRAGWKEALYKNESLEISNFSVGACSSGVAVCQALKHKSFEYDINILELSINDGIMLSRGELSEEHVRLYIDGMFDLMLSAGSTVILLIFPEKTYLEDKTKTNPINAYYKQKASQFNIPVIDGYAFVDALLNEVPLDVLFLDKNHLNEPIAYKLGEVVNDAVETFIAKKFTKKSIEKSCRSVFDYLSAENLIDSSQKLIDVATSLRSEQAMVLHKDEVLQLKSDAMLCGLYIDTNNSKTLIRVEGSKEIVTNAYRSEIKTTKPQFLYMPLQDPLPCKGELMISIADKNTPIDEDSWLKKRVDTDENFLVLFGLLFCSIEENRLKNCHILTDDSLKEMQKFINMRLEEKKEMIKENAQNLQRKLIIHIGMNKTGSSSIQESMHKNLYNERFKYMQLSSPNHSGPLQMLFLKNSNTNASIAARALTIKENRVEKNRIQSNLINQIVEVQSAKFILSGEGLTKLSEEELLNLKLFFNRFFSHISIVGYVRTPKSFIESSFQQRLKGPKSVNRINNISPEYYQRFNKFDNIFGKKNVMLWKFDPKTFPEGDVVLDFCQKLGIPFMKEQSIKVNESLSLEAIALLYVYRKYGPSYGVGKGAGAEMAFIVKKLSQFGHKKFKTSPSLMKPILENLQEDIGWMEARLGESLSESMKDESDAIHSEEELEKIALESVKELLPLVDQKYIPEGTDTTTIEGVVATVHALRLMARKKMNPEQKDAILPNEILNTTKEENMNPTVVQIVENLKNEMPNLATKLNEKQFQRIVMKTLEQVNTVIETSEEKVVRIPKLGNFRKNEIEKDGVKTMRIVFTAAKPKEKAAE